MMLRRIVIGCGLALMAFGIWTFTQVYSEVGTCSSNVGSAARSGLDSSCVQTVMSYSLGFVFVASGLIIMMIAITMIAKQERIDLRSELKSVPRTWAKRDHVITSNSLDRPIEVPSRLVSTG